MPRLSAPSQWGAIYAALALQLFAPLTLSAQPATSPKSSAAALSSDAANLLDWVRTRRDNDRMPFVIVDKKMAMVHVFDATAALKGSSPVLLGLAKGDDSVPGIGKRKLADIQPAERTTPAGRFSTEPGRNLFGEDIVWIDYDAAVSMHRVRATKSAERRLERLATPTPADNRISYGCINVPVSFYDAYVRPSLGRARGLVYVLPEINPLSSLIPQSPKSNSGGAYRP